MNKVIGVLMLLFFAFIGAGCKDTTDSKSPQVEKPAVGVDKEESIRIMTTDKLLYHAVRDIVADKHIVDYMLKSEKQHWDFEYSEDSLNNISKKDLFIYWGSNYEPWIPKFLEEIKKGKVGLVNSSRGIRLLPLNNPRKYKENELKENPYFWLNPEDYKIALANIKNSIEEKDPKEREFYETNYNESLKNIDKFIKDFKDLIGNYKKYNYIVVGDNLDYFVRFLNVKVVKIDSTMQMGQEKDKLEKKLEGLENIVFLHNDKDDGIRHEYIIKKYKMIPVHLITYEFDMKYLDILEYNYNSMKKIDYKNLQEY